MREENRALLGPADVILAAHPGSGASWIATLLVHLGVFYASGHEERLLDRASQRTGGWLDDAEQRLPGQPASGAPSVGVADRHEHLPALRRRHELEPSYREALRVVKSNDAPLAWAPDNKVLLLVRDGRDAVLSLYHYLRTFSGLDVPLLDYLTGNGGAWPLPALSWGFACQSWAGTTSAERLHVLRFESCRAEPLAEVRAMLRFLGVERDDAEIERALAASSYERMRRDESAAIERRGDAIGRGRIMRKGLVGEWREVYTDAMLRTFSGLPRRALERFGYPTDAVP